MVSTRLVFDAKQAADGLIDEQAVSFVSLRLDLRSRELLIADLELWPTLKGRRSLVRCLYDHKSR